MKLRELVISITDYCNAKCIMCGIWKKEKRYGFDIDLLSKLPRYIKRITLTGGEPFLEDKLVAFIFKIKKLFPLAKVIINTNGLDTDLINKKIKEILKIEPHIIIRVSLDGIGSTHDRIRGYSGAYNRVIETIDLLKKLKVKDLGLIFTIINENIEQLDDVYNLAQKLEIEFNCQVVHSSNFFFNQENQGIKDKETLRKELENLVNLELKTFSIYKLFKAYYHKKIWDYVNQDNQQYSCLAGSLFCYIDTEGGVYPCIMLKEKMGDFKENDFSHIYNSKRAKEIRMIVKNCPKKCFLICRVGAMVRYNPYKALLWVLENKIKAHLGNTVL